MIHLWLSLIVRQLRAPASHVCTYHRSQNCPPLAPLLCEIGRGRKDDPQILCGRKTRAPTAVAAVS